jgi:nitroreductase
MDFMRVMKERFAAKSFDLSKKISTEDVEKIIEFGRLSPSSLGLEPWKFVVISNQELKDKLVPACFGQPQVGNASELIVILNNKVNFKDGSTFLADTFNSRLPEDIAKKMIPTYQGFLDNMNDEQKNDWGKRQCFIAAANMMTGAKSLGIDSCPMEGFVEDKVLEILGIDYKDYGVAMVVPFGFADKPGYPKTRFSVEEVVEYRK